MMLEIPDLHPFRTLPKAHADITILETGVVLKFERGPGEGNPAAILTLSAEDAMTLYSVLWRVGQMSGKDQLQISGTVVEGAK